MNLVAPLFVIGTRPEAIKLAPLVLACARRTEAVRATVCLTGQHREMVAPVIDYFGIRADVDLDVMTPGQELSALTARLLERLEGLVAERSPDCIVAQGDTTSVLAAALVAFYRRVPLVHVEAGLRTGNLQAPWPEEFNRRVASLAAAVHCAPTERARAALVAEGISPQRIHVTGNPVVDALVWTVERERRAGAPWNEKYAAFAGKPLLLITGHRRENFGAPLANLCAAVARLADQFKEVSFVYPVHLNPRVQGPVHEALAGRPNVHLLPPLPYPQFVWLMDRSTLILTDSGGIQEEALSLGKPVLVAREATERPEALESGLVQLVGSDPQAIVQSASRLLRQGTAPGAAAPRPNPFGDGRAGERIVELIVRRAWTA